MAYAAMTNLAAGALVTEAEWDKIGDNFSAIVPLTPGAWTTWVPTFTNFTIGNGVTTAVYQRTGRWIVFYLKVILGSSSSMGSLPNFTLPVTEATRYTASIDKIGETAILDSGTAVFFGSTHWVSAGKAQFNVSTASGTYMTNAGITSTVPMTWTTSDGFVVTGWYEAAAGG